MAGGKKAIPTNAYPHGEQDGPDVPKRIQARLDAQIDLARDRMALMDRTWAGSDFVRTRGRVPRGKRRRLPIAAESIDGEDSDHRG